MSCPAAPPRGSVVRGVGLDLVSIPRFAATLARWGRRFTDRLFTPGELAYARSRGRPEIHLAGRFAAKEAFLKALGIGLRKGVSFREVEVISTPGEAPRIVLHKKTLVICSTNGYITSHLSITHHGEYAAACVVAVGTAQEGTP